MAKIINYMLISLLTIAVACCGYLYISKNNIIYEKEELINSLNKEVAKRQEEIKKLNNSLRAKEVEDYEKFSKIQKENENLRVTVASGERKLRIKIASCTNASGEVKSSSVGDGEATRADIDARDAQSIIAITEKADRYKSQLEALQNYINTYNIEIDKKGGNK